MKEKVTHKELKLLQITNKMVIMHHKIFKQDYKNLENSRGYSNSADSVKTIEEQQREWRENVRKADDKAESEAKSRHIVKEADQILSVISRDNAPLDNGEFNQNTPFDNKFNQIPVDQQTQMQIR